MRSTFKFEQLLFLLFLISVNVRAQSTESMSKYVSYFDEIRSNTADHRSLWNVDLYAPMLFVDPETRAVYANAADSAGALQPNGQVFTGKLPASVNISNTSLKWNGVNWAMIMLPLPEQKQDRINLLAHELFHRAQKSLGFVAYNPDNNHLDQKDGRVYLRLELEALKKALTAEDYSETKTHLTNALTFRAYRHRLYPGADSTENLLELNEGITEFTGVMLSGRNEEQMREHFNDVIDRFILNPTYVRSFAYHTIPVYGYLLSKTRKDWNKSISGNTDLTSYLRKSFEITLPGNLAGEVQAVSSVYGAESILAEETKREEASKQRIAAFKKRLVEQPHLELPLQNMNMSFDFRIIVPLENYGTVYPVIRVTDNWGILDVKSGALISTNWDKISVSLPLSMEPMKIAGEGWTLELKEPFRIVKAPDGNYRIEKK